MCARPRQAQVHTFGYGVSSTSPQELVWFQRLSIVKLRKCVKCAPRRPLQQADTGAPQSIARSQVFLGPSNNNSICLLALLSSFRRQATNRHVAAGGPTVQGTAIQNGISNRNQSVANHTAGLLASRFDTTASHRVSARSLHPSPTPHTAAQAQDVRRR